MEYLKQFKTLDELQKIKLTDKSVIYYNGTTEFDFSKLVKIEEGNYYLTKHEIASVKADNLQQAIQIFIRKNILQHIGHVGSLLSIKNNNEIILWNGDESDDNYWDPFSTTIIDLTNPTNPTNPPNTYFDDFGTPVAVCIGKGEWVYVGTPSYNQIWNNHPWAISGKGMETTIHTIVCYEYDGYKNTKNIINSHTEEELRNTIWDQIKTSQDFVPHDFLRKYTYVPSYYELMEMNGTIAKSQYTTVDHTNDFWGYDIGLTNIGRLIFKQALNTGIVAFNILSSTEYTVSKGQYLSYNLRQNTTLAIDKTNPEVHAIAFLHLSED